MDYSKSLLVANWKMNKTIASTKSFVETIKFINNVDDKNIVICPPITLFSYLKDLPFSLGAQDCSSLSLNEGAFTGEISAQMLKDAGCSYVIIGHSERRKHNNEVDNLIKSKIEFAHQAGLVAILCVGEDLITRENGKYLQVLASQIKGSLPNTANTKNTIIAYEPVWAIGANKAADVKQIEEVHKFLHNHMEGLKILYGGSVNIKNAEDILSTAYVSGLLIGGASLEAENFNKIIQIRGK